MYRWRRENGKWRRENIGEVPPLEHVGIERPAIPQQPTKKGKATMPKNDAKEAAIYIFEETASVVFQQKDGWYVRGYHSPVVMKAHLKHLTKGAPPPKHFPPNYDWRSGYGVTGPFTKKQAMDYACGEG
jgi:hypothetical protein